MGQVYLVQNNNHIKIGYSIRAKKRLKDLTKTAYENKLIAIKDNVDMLFEKELHKRYNKHRVCGEWFLFSIKEVDTIINYYGFEKLLSFDGGDYLGQKLRFKNEEIVQLNSRNDFNEKSIKHHFEMKTKYLNLIGVKNEFIFKEYSPRFDNEIEFETKKEFINEVVRRYEEFERVDIEQRREIDKLKAYIIELTNQNETRKTT